LNYQKTQHLYGLTRDLRTRDELAIDIVEQALAFTQHGVTDGIENSLTDVFIT